MQYFPPQIKLVPHYLGKLYTRLRKSIFANLVCARAVVGKGAVTAVTL